ncbi:MAG: fumarylacetoacetate hydrolase family protein [Candidatus Nanopelagicales bacterium]|nr:fumarylacetoacetate hydrolase family protein [Candidatus Nanopelagicales bacterium]MCU0298123.1 fumarylacetoacetate hydrolase family protein [Candidatus Nanopelagicales bacterium]
MRIARYRYEGDVRYGIVDGEVVREIEGTPFPTVESIEVTGIEHHLDDVDLLAPVLPTKIIAVAKNYSDHAAEMGGTVPAEPMIFLKPSTSVVGPEAVIALPEQSTQVEHEAELAVIIGRLCKDVPEDRVEDVVLGYTCANDVTARDLQAKDGQWGRAKGFDTFCPLGPWIATDVDPDELAIECEVNEQIRQDGNTANMVRSVAELVAWISRVMTLVPGDVILTGTPAGVGPLRNGDSVTVTIEGIGTLDNIVSDTGVFS